MTKQIVSISLAICIAFYPLLTVGAATVPANEPQPIPRAATLSAEQIDNLMAPIALYPDPLIAQMLPASTYVDQIDKAARYLRANNNQTTGVDNQDWEVSVRSIAHYPQVVYSMSEKLDWTTAIGQAYVTQAVDVFGSIQRLRHKAKEYGYLKTTPQQTVIVEKDVIKIVPAQAQYIYVPTYNPQVVYVPAPTSSSSSSGASTGEVVATAAIAFTAGLLIGAWLNNDCNWYSHSVYYHGWHGSGWVARSTTVVRVGGSPYVNPRYNTVRYNSGVVNRKVNYNNVSHYNNVSRNVNYNNVNVNRNVNVNNVNVNNKNLNRNINTNNVKNAEYRGKAPTATPTTANRASAQQRTSGFGGYGSGAQTKAQSSRGKFSRSSRPTTTTTRTKPTRTRSGGRKR